MSTQVTLTKVIDCMALQGFITQWVRQLPLRVCDRCEEPCETQVVVVPHHQVLMRDDRLKPFHAVCLCFTLMDLYFMNIFREIHSKEALQKREISCYTTSTGLPYYGVVCPWCCYCSSNDDTTYKHILHFHLVSFGMWKVLCMVHCDPQSHSALISC